MSERSLEDISINGFRGLRHLKLEGLGRLNLLVGANNSGKTSVIEALSILCRPFDPYEWTAMVRRRDFGGLDETRIQSLRWCFHQSGELSDPDLLFEGQARLSRLGRGGSILLRVDYEDLVGEPAPRELERLTRRRDRTGDLPAAGDWRGARITHFVKVEPGSKALLPPASDAETAIEPVSIQLWEEDPIFGRRSYVRRREQIPTETLTPYSYQLNRGQVRSQSQQMFTRRKRKTSAEPDYLLEIIHEFDPEVTEIGVASFRGDRPAIYLNHKRLGPSPLSVYGDAVRRVVLLANTLQQLKGGGVLLIDEIETGIHVSALERVFTWLSKVAEKLDVQVFATTHSLEVVDAIAESMAGAGAELITYHLDQTPEGTNVKRIPGELLLRLRRERGLDVR
ncbi:AAA family ATPase [Planctomyces sp. SH-PL14]|uniref:AAA family ATPase n=1 Tax=Planctomyces sp. SH-PL14 TaxID=1632864 RepID=UPI0009464F94|nr:ATP-binding protein [Planctomyces sp. SH-PL14]